MKIWNCLVNIYIILEYERDDAIYKTHLRMKLYRLLLKLERNLLRLRFDHMSGMTEENIMHLHSNNNIKKREHNLFFYIVSEIHILQPIRREMESDLIQSKSWTLSFVFNIYLQIFRV